MRFRVGLSMFLGLFAPVSWGAPPLIGCAIEPDKVAEVGTPVIGVVESLHVERGQHVRKGQVLAVLRADVERASLAVASARAQADADVQAAAANHDFLKDKQRRAEELVQKNFISRQALEQARAESRIAEQKLAQAREQQRVWQRERDLAHAQLSMRSIKAPFDGIIADRLVLPGERVETKPLFRIAKVNPLRVELMVPAAMYGSLVNGSALDVTPELPNMQALRAKVVMIDPLMDAPSNTFRARAELANPTATFPSGVRCKAALATPPGAEKAQAAAPVRPAPPEKAQAAAPMRPAPPEKAQAAAPVRPAPRQSEVTAAATPAGVVKAVEPSSHLRLSLSLAKKLADAR